MDPVVSLPNVPKRIFSAILEYAYLGHVVVDKEDVERFKEEANNLQLVGFQEGSETAARVMTENEAVDQRAEEGRCSTPNPGMPDPPFPAVVHIPIANNIVKTSKGAFKCLSCGQESRYHKDVVKHYRRKHEVLPKVKCPIGDCEKIVSNEYSLPDHLRKVHGVSISDIKKSQSEATPAKKMREN